MFQKLININLLNTKIKMFSVYRAINTVSLDYEHQSVNAVQENN
jgi:hypothetical protein